MVARVTRDRERLFEEITPLVVWPTATVRQEVRLRSSKRAGCARTVLGRYGLVTGIVEIRFCTALRPWHSKEEMELGTGFRETIKIHFTVNWDEPGVHALQTGPSPEGFAESPPNAPRYAADEAQPPVRRRMSTITGCCGWIYLVVVITVVILIYCAGDRWWLATLLLFGPRWLCALPLALLVPAALRWRRGVLLPLAVAAILVVWPLMGFCVSWHAGSQADGSRLRVLTCNLKGRCRGNAAFQTLLRQTTPDIVALQGCWKLVDIEWPAGWHLLQSGEILVASRYPLSDPEAVDAAERRHAPAPRLRLLDCLVDLPDGKCHFVALHLPSPHSGIAEMLDRSTVIDPSRHETIDEETERRQHASELASDWASSFSDPLILAGDFNMPVESSLYRTLWDRFFNAFSCAGFGFGYTEWPTIRGPRFGIRIDHILTSAHWRAERCWVGPYVGSDHLPVIADLVRRSSP